MSKKLNFESQMAAHSTSEGDTKNQLKPAMKSRHVVMLSLGGAIGAGLFAGSGQAIGAAGPAVILAYLLAGAVLFMVIYGVGQMVLAQKTGEQAVGMSGLITPYVGDRLGHFEDWVYLVNSLAVMIAEAAAIAQFLHLWWPQIPSWIFVLIVAILSLGINLYSVKAFAETEYWLAVAKIAVVIVLIAIGLVFLFTQVLDMGPARGLSQMNAHGGFMPYGMSGVFSAMLMVIYSYGGSEMLALTISEVENPKEAIPKAIRGLMSRIIAFYVLPIFLFLELFSWKFLSTTSASPFVLVFEKIGIPYAGDVVNLVIILAMFSVIDSMVYGTSRSLFARTKDSKSGLGKWLGTLSKHHTPVNAIAFCSGALFIGVILSYIFGQTLFGFMAGSISYTILITWIMLTVAALVLYFKNNMALWKKIMGIVCLIILIVVFINLILDNSWKISIFALGVAAIAFLSYRKKS